MTSMIGNTGMRQRPGMMGDSLMGNPTGQGSRGMTGGNIVPKGYKMGQLQQFTPEQMQLFQQMFGQVGPESYLGRLAGGDQSAFEQMEAPALKQFNQLLGGISSKFSQGGGGGILGTGALGTRHSSGFQNQTTQAASDFAQKLQSQRMGLQRQALMDMMGMQESLLGMSPYQRFLIEKQHKSSIWGKLLGAGLPIAGAIAGGVFGGPMGAALGGQLGSAAGSGFSGGSYQGNYSGIGDLPTKWG